MDRTTDNSTDRRLSNSPNHREDHLRMRRERERARRAYETPKQRKEWCRVRRERDRGCPKHGRRKNFSLDQRAIEYNIRRRLHRREQNQEQRKVAKLTQLVEARVHRRDDSTREQKRIILLTV